LTTTITRYAYDMWNPAKAEATGTSGSDIWATFTTGGSLTMRELQGDGIDQHLAYVAGGDAYWYLTDHLNSIRAVLNSSGGVTASVAYDAYGNLTTAAAPGLYDWTGREFDVETGLYYNRARYYEPGTGRWISQDPMGFDAGDSNLYRYAANNPLSNTDPSGTEVLAPANRLQTLVDLQTWLQNGTGPLANIPGFGNVGLGLETQINQAPGGRYFLSYAGNAALAQARKKLPVAQVLPLRILDALSSTTDNLSVWWASDIRTVNELRGPDTFFNGKDNKFWTFGVSPTTLSFSEKVTSNLVWGKDNYNLGGLGLLPGYTVPTKEGSYSLPEFGQMLGAGPYSPPNTTRDAIYTQLEDGCIGLARVAVAGTGAKNYVTNSMQDKVPGPDAFPQFIKGVEGAWLTFEDAKTRKGLPPLGAGDKRVIIAIQGFWKGGEEPKAQANGLYPLDSVITDATGLGSRFNYVTYFPDQGVWIDANHLGTWVPNQKQVGMPTGQGGFSEQKWNVSTKTPPAEYTHGDRSVSNGLIFIDIVWRKQMVQSP
jgi:RHS repeat-associated protein